MESSSGNPDPGVNIDVNRFYCKIMKLHRSVKWNKLNKMDVRRGVLQERFASFSSLA